MQSMTVKTSKPEAPPDDIQPANDDAKPECRALIAVSPVARPSPRAGARRAAEFTTQLLAAQNKLPQVRDRRRADPAEALAAYRAAAQLMALQ